MEDIKKIIAEALNPDKTPLALTQIESYISSLITEKNQLAEDLEKTQNEIKDLREVNTKLFLSKGLLVEETPAPEVEKTPEEHMSEFIDYFRKEVTNER